MLSVGNLYQFPGRRLSLPERVELGEEVLLGRDALVGKQLGDLRVGLQPQQQLLQLRLGLVGTVDRGREGL